MADLRYGPVWAILLAVGTGAAIGACMRWGLSYLLNAKIPGLPMGTLAANLIAGLLIGCVTAWFSFHMQVSPLVRLFLVTGFLGGLSTLSTFSMENVAMLLTGNYMMALLHAAMHFLGTLTMTVLGYETVKTIMAHWN